MAKSIDNEIQRILRDEVLLEDSLNPPRTAALVKTERSIRKVLNQWLRQSGLDTKALGALEADHQRERRRGVIVDAAATMSASGVLDLHVNDG